MFKDMDMEEILMVVVIVVLILMICRNSSILEGFPGMGGSEDELVDPNENGPPPPNVNGPPPNMNSPSPPNSNVSRQIQQSVIMSLFILLTDYLPLKSVDSNLDSSSILNLSALLASLGLEIRSSRFSFRLETLDLPFTPLILIFSRIIGM